MNLADLFSPNWNGAPFELFGAAHLAMLAAIMLFNLWLLRFKNAPHETKKRLRLALSLALWGNEAGYHLWKMTIGQWTVQEMLPLHLCSMLIWLSGWMLLWRNATLYEFIYFLGIGGGVNALLTPDSGPYGFPHYRFFQPLIAHGLLVSAAIYMTGVEGFRPTWQSLLRVAVVTNLYMLGVYFINLALGSNYMMLNAKPGVPSLYDLMPPWPWYLIVVELLGLGICLLLYLPFAIANWRTARKTP